MRALLQTVQNPNINLQIALIILLFISCLITAILLYIIKINEKCITSIRLRKFLVILFYTNSGFALLEVILTILLMTIQLFEQLFFMNTIILVQLNLNKDQINFDSFLIDLFFIYPAILITAKIMALKRYNTLKMQREEFDFELFSMSIIISKMNSISFDIIANVINVIVAITTVLKYTSNLSQPILGSLYIYSACCFLLICVTNKRKELLIKLDNRLFKTELILKPYNGLLKKIWKVNYKIFVDYIKTGNFTYKLPTRVRVRKVKKSSAKQ